MNGYPQGMETPLILTNANHNNNNLLQQRTHFYVKRASLFALGKSKYTITSEHERYTGTVSLKKMNTLYDENDQPQFKFQLKSGGFQNAEEKTLLFSGGGGKEEEEPIQVKFKKNSSHGQKSCIAQFFNKVSQREETLFIRSDNFGTFNRIYYGNDEHGPLLGTLEKANMVQMSFNMDIYPGVDKFFVLALGFCIEKLFNAKVGRLGAAAAIAI